MLRVCHIISGDLWAGAEVMACHLLKYLHGVEELNISVILLNEGRLANELHNAGLQIEVIDEAKYSFTQILTRTRQILSINPPCIIHTHRYKENVIAWLASRSQVNCHLIATQHGLPEHYGCGFSVYSRLVNFVNFFLLKNFFTKVVTVSSDIQNFFIDQRRFPFKRIEVIRNGIEIPSTTDNRDSNVFFLIGSSGRLSPVKDYPLMVKIAIALKDTENIKFALAGEGPERGRIERLIDYEKLHGSFELKGHLNDIDSFYRNLNLYINTSLHEGIPLAILEAMAHGLPIIAPRVGGIPEVINDGVEGFLIEGRDPQTFADKCMLLAKDNILWKRMSIASLEKAKELFSVQRMGKNYLNLYENILCRYKN